MANVEMHNEPLHRPADQVSPFPKEPKPSTADADKSSDAARKVASESDKETTEGTALADRAKRIQDASADAMNDIAQSMLRGWTEIVRGIRKAVDRF